MNETESTLNIRLEVVVTDENINDIMACALEGGINYWADDAQVIEEYLDKGWIGGMKAK